MTSKKTPEAGKAPIRPRRPAGEALPWAIIDAHEKIRDREMVDGRADQDGSDPVDARRTEKAARTKS